MSRKVVIPGELVTEERKRLGHNVYMRDGKIYSDVLGLVSAEGNEASVIPLEGRYIPKENDLVVGVVTAEKFGGYTIDINSVGRTFLSNDKIMERLKTGSIVSVRIVMVNELNEAEIDNARVFYGGELVKIDAVKIPRVIGKNGSMLEVLKTGTKCSLLVGRNGYIWVKGGNTSLLTKALEKIKKEAHRPNLTNKMAEYLNVENKVKNGVS